LPFNLDFRLEADTIEDLLIEEPLITESNLILQIKKPDYLGESMWEFRFNRKNIPAKVTDKAWLERFQKGHFVILPGDALHAVVKIIYRRDAQGKLSDPHYEILKVMKLIPMSDHNQTTLIDEPNEENT